MPDHLKDFWRRLQTGVEVSVAGNAPERLLGVREAFVRYFHQGLQRPSSIVVVPQAAEEPSAGLPMSDQETLALARQQAKSLREGLGEAYHFYVAVQGGLESLELDNRPQTFIRSWCVITSPLGEAWGSSGAVLVPERALSLSGPLGAALAVAGTRRQGGMVSSITAGLETRKSAVAEATLHALASLCFGVFQSRDGQPV